MDLLTSSRVTRRPALLLTAAALVGLALGLALARHRTPSTLADAWPRAAHAATPAPHAVVVAQPADCASRYTALARVVHAARRVGATITVLVPGDEAARLDVARRLAAFGTGVRVQSATRPALRAVRALGFDTTPVLVVLDANGRVHLAAPFPSTLEALRQWHTVVPAAFGP